MAEFIKVPYKSKLYQAKKDGVVEVLVGGINVDHFAPSVNFSYKLESGSEKYFVNICDDKIQMDTGGKEEEWNGSDKIKIKDKEESTFLVSDIALKIERVFYEHPTEAPRYKIEHSADVIPYLQKSIFEDYQDLVQEWVGAKESPSDLPQSFDEYNSQHYRPDNVVGSYAIYCDKQGHYKNADGNTKANYGCGKISHIYAPYWTDSSGKKIKGIQEIIGNTLTFALPTEEWLDSAILPIALDPDIGYTTAGASEFAPPNFNRYGVKWTTASDESGDLDSVSIAWKNINVSLSRSVAVGLYEGTTPGSLPDMGEIESALKAGGYDTKVDETNDFLELDFTSEGDSISASTDYWLTAQAYNTIGAATSDFRWYYDTTPTKSLRWSAFSNPWAGLVNASGSTHNLSIFFTYTSSGGGRPLPQRVLSGPFSGPLNGVF